MLFVTNTISNNEINEINNFFNEFDNIETVTPELTEEKTIVEKYVTSLATSRYQKSIEEINGVQNSNKIVRKKSFQQIMQQSLFYGSNRFGNNFIA